MTGPARVAVLFAALLVGLVGLPPAASAAGEPLRGPDVRTFMDDLVSRQLADFRLPGAAVSVVADGRQVLAKGYGQADVEAERPVEADRTRFHIDSVSKLITATAVMQLVEQGRLDLNADVNRYLTEFKIRDTYPGKPVTLAHLLTHTAGFEDPLIGSSTTNRPDLGDHLAAAEPDRVRPPGTVHSYSDYGFELAGYLVQMRSGMAFERYVEKHIFSPLGMSSTSFATSPPEAARIKERSNGYTVEDGRMTEAERGFENRAPSVGVVSTATDMSRFMLAQLGGGAVGDVRILKRPTVQSMQRRQFGQDPRFPGLTFPFTEARDDGRRLLGHSGEGSGSHSMLTLLPERGMGVFVTYNGDGIGENPLFGGAYSARLELRDEFLKRFVPAEATAARQVDEPDLRQYTGTYRWTKFNGDDPALLFALLSAPADLRVKADGKGGLTTTGFSTDPDGAGQAWYPVGDGLFHERDGRQQLAFTKNDDGNGFSVATSYGYYVFVFERTAWYESPALHLTVAGTGLLLLLTMLAWPVAALIRRIRRRTARSDRGPRMARSSAAVTAFLIVGSVVAASVAAMSGRTASGFWLVLPVLTVVGVAVSMTYAALAWRHRWWNGTARAHLTVVTLGMIAFLGVARYYHLFFPA
ncbi:serine hydrolase domain-containing protein [Actinomadura sp. 7K507]|uniref:serine hydrolase domain-containing protein n=1 Tax=Actinomadura sp. 7K507 TaxID=2530365 RepID=UPI0010507970|nr:serine hydrolase domain-containing protein [Actinomadura sp. 7K507]TDC95699.1 serine hydrolase [Actinomadura sp. 7K507]